MKLSIRQIKKLIRENLDLELPDDRLDFSVPQGNVSDAVRDQFSAYDIPPSVNYGEMFVVSNIGDHGRHAVIYEVDQRASGKLSASQRSAQLDNTDVALENWAYETYGQLAMSQHKNYFNDLNVVTPSGEMNPSDILVLGDFL